MFEPSTERPYSHGSSETSRIQNFGRATFVAQCDH